MEIEPTVAAIRRISSVPTIARPPTSSGSAAATRLRKKSDESRNRSGNASSSARLRSDSVCLFTCSVATA